MGISSYSKIQVKDKDMMAIQEAVAQVFQQYQILPILGGHLLTDIALVSGSANQISHGLSGKLTGWILTRNRAGGIVWDSQDTNTNNRLLFLNTSANTTVDLWVF